MGSPVGQVRALGLPPDREQPLLGDKEGSSVSPSHFEVRSVGSPADRDHGDRRGSEDSPVAASTEQVTDGAESRAVEASGKRPQQRA